MKRWLKTALMTAAAGGGLVLGSSALAASAFTIQTSTLGAVSANLAGGAIVCNAPDHDFASSVAGTSANWASGAVDDTDASGYDVNWWNNSGLTVYWSSAPAISAGVASSTSSADLTVLSTGAVVGPSSTWSRTGGAMTAFRAGVDGYMGFRFQCAAGTCYGYAHITTTAGTGYPAKLKDYCYDQTGAAITIGPVAPPPVADVSPSSLTFTVDQGESDSAPLTIANTGGGSLTYTVTESEAAAAPTRSYLTAQQAFEKGALTASGYLSRAPGAGSDAQGWPITLNATDISQMADNTPGDQGVSCGVQGTSTADNSWWRRFYFNEHPAVGASAGITSVTISTGSIAIPGGLPATVNLYTLPHSTAVNTIPTGSLTLIGTADTTLSGALQSITVPVTGTVSDTVGLDLVVEVHTDGNTSGGQYFPGANATPETHPTFLSSATCGLAQPQTTTSIGFPDFHLTMVVTIDGDTPPPVGCDNPSDIPWLSEAPTSGSVSEGDSATVTVTADASGMAAGTYSANVCVATNDATNPMISVPVHLTVATGGGGGDEVLVVDLSTVNQVTITAGNGTSQSTLSGSTTTGFLFQNLFANAGTQAIGTSTIVGTATLTAASVPPDGSPSLFRSSDTDAGLNIWSYSTSSTTTFTAGQPAFAGTATWTITPALYAAMLTAPTTGDVYFPADDSGDIAAAAQLIGSYKVVTGGSGGDPAIDVSPASLSASQAANTTTTQTLAISNTGGGSLDWTITEALPPAAPMAPVNAAVKVNTPVARSSTPLASADMAGRVPNANVPNGSTVLYDQTSNLATTSTVSQAFEVDFAPYDNMGADDFTVPAGATWTINSVDAVGTYFNGFGPAQSFAVFFYADAGGKPGSQLGGAAGLAYADATGMGSPTINLTSPVVLTAGHYWISIQGRLDFATEGEWGWTDAFTEAGSPGQWINPGDGFASGCVDWTNKLTCIATASGNDYGFRLKGTDGGTPPAGGCDNPSDLAWASASPTSGSTAGGATSNVTVTFNSTGMAEGTYSGLLCVASNDADTPSVEVPVSMTVTGGGTDPDNFCSAPINHAVQNNIDGTSVNWITGDVQDADVAGYHFNPYNNNTQLTFWWSTGAPDIAGVSSSATTSDFLVLHDNDVVGPSSTWSTVNNPGPAAWAAGADGYLGFRFNCSTLPNPPASGICYGYVHMTTTAPTGFPATIVDYCYNKAGNPITIGGGSGGGDPVASVTPSSLSFSVAQDASGTNPLSIANVGGGSLTWSITESTAGSSNVAGRPYHAPTVKPNAGGTWNQAPHAVNGAHGSPITLNAMDISQMADNTPGDQGVSCGVQGTSTADNSWWRRFYFNEHPAVGASTGVTSVTISTGSIDVGGLPVTVNLYTAPHSAAVDTIPTGSLTMIGTANATLTGALQSITVPVTGTVSDTVGMDLVVEIHTDGNTAGGQFFPGANATAETHPTFLSSATCGLAQPQTAASIGFPDFHLTMVVTLDGDAGPTGCDNPSDIPWLSANPASGNTAGGATSTSTITANTAGMAPGTYSANICVATNDPANALVTVPVSLTVTPGGGGGELLTVDLTTPNQVKISAAGGTSMATISGSTTTGFLFQNFFGAGSQAIGTTSLVGAATLTAASVPADGSPELFRSGSTDAGLNIWSYSATSTTTFTAGQVAFAGSATWSISPALYQVMLNAPATGNLYFPADDTGDISAGAQLLGTYRVISGGGVDPKIQVTPTPMSFSVDAGASSSNPLTVKNIGGGTLTYSIAEAASARPTGSFKTAAGRLANKAGTTATLGNNTVAANPYAGSRATGQSVTLNASDISQMADNTPGDQGVSCGVQGTSTADNSWWRRFYFNEHPAVGASTGVTSVTISTGSIDVGGLPVTVNLYTLPHSTAVDTIPTGSLTLIGTADATLTGALESITVPVTGTVSDTAAMDLVVEIYTDGNASGGQYFPGANATPETHPTFLSSATCGLAQPQTATAIGFPDFHLTMVVTVDGDGGGTGGGCQNPSDVPWLSVTPTSGSLAGGAQADSTVTVNAGSLAAGTYSANLCVTSNDTTNPLVTVPVNVTVTPGTVTPCSAADTIFCDGFDPAGGGETFTQPLQDPSFEATTTDAGSNPFWTGTDSNDPTGGTPFYSASGFGIDVRTGDFEVWFGGWRATSEVQTFSQTVDIAAGGPRYVNYWRNVVAAPAGTATLKIYVDGTVVSTKDVTAWSAQLGSWVNESVDITAQAGGSHTIKFEFTFSGSDDGNLFIDDVTIDDHQGSMRATSTH